MFLLGFRRKMTVLALCKSIESAIQWFQIHHRITFATIQNPAVYLSGARVSIFSTLVPRLFIIFSLKYSKHEFNILSIAPTIAKSYRIPAISSQHLVKFISNGNLYLDNLQIIKRPNSRISYNYFQIPSNYAKQVDFNI